MKTLVCPLGGSSTRFPPGFRPKWINQVFGNMMITQAIKGCYPNDFDNIVFIVNEKQNCYKNILLKENPNSIVVVVENTISAPEAVYLGLNKLGINNGGLLIRDCDSIFNLPKKINWSRNWIAVNDIHNIDLVNARNKSYVKIDKNNTVGNIAEKHIISNLFNVGGYFFKDIKHFNKYYKLFEGRTGLFVSDIIYKMLLDKHLFFSELVDSYVDLGTWDDLLRFYIKCRSDKTIVVDVDDTIFVKDPIDSYQDVVPKKKMVNYLQRKQKEGCYIVLFSSRNMNSFNNNIGWINKYTIPILVETLKRYNIPFDELFMGKPWTGHNGFILDDKMKCIKKVLQE